jgi:hypothetical protein
MCPLSVRAGNTQPVDGKPAEYREYTDNEWNRQCPSEKCPPKGPFCFAVVVGTIVHFWDLESVTGAGENQVFSFVLNDGSEAESEKYFSYFSPVRCSFTQVGRSFSL